MLGVWLSMHASTASHHSIQHHHKTGQSNHSVQVQSAELNRPTKIDIDLCVSTVVADDLFQALFSPFLAGGDADLPLWMVEFDCLRWLGCMSSARAGTGD